MSVLLHCFSPPWRPSSTDFLRRRCTVFPARFHVEAGVSKEIGLLPFRKQEIGGLYIKTSMRSKGSSKKGHILLSGYSISTEPGVLLTLKLEEINRLSGLLSNFYHVIMDPIYDHQGVTSFSYPKMFAAANTLMLILPLEALAETCGAEKSISSMPLFFIIALIGATVGGLLARQRRGELKRLNDQLRQINAALRRQAKIESYAPNLSYAPVGRIPETEVIVDPRKQQLITKLRTGKNYLRNQEPEKAFVEFKAAFELAQILGDHIEMKKAARGLGASLQKQDKYREAIKYHSKVLELAKKVGEDSGSTEAYGAIADCYTELGDLERAAKFYDKYIARLEND